MKYILLILCLLFTTPSLSQKQKNGVIYDATILRVIDGDTVVIEAAYLPPPLKPELSLRIFGVDTPEVGFRAECATESQKGTAASIFTKNIIKNAKHKQIVLIEWDKYGGRVLGDILIDGKSLRMLLIDNGFAREYYGDAKKSWCN